MRGVVELPAIAIFTITAGSLIILFFIVLTQSQGNQAQKDIQAKNLQSLDTLLKSAATAQMTATNISVIDDTLVFTCDETGTWFGYENNIQLPMQNTIIFSPHFLRGGKLSAYSAGANVPYRAFDVLYLASPENIIYTDVGLLDYPFETATVTSRPGDDYRLVKAASSGAAPTTKNTVYVYQETENTGSVTYYGGGSIFYPTKELLYGAILSNNNNTYNCVFDQYLNQLRFVSTVQKGRLEYIYNNPGSDPYCQALYLNGKATFNTIINLPNAADFDGDAVIDFNKAISELEYYNQRLMQGSNCATIY